MIAGRFAGLALAAALACVPVLAPAAEEESGAHQEPHFHANFLAVKLGVHFQDNENDALIGLEYSRYLDEQFAWSVSLDYLDSDEVDRELALIPPEVRVRVVDIHAETTSEKMCMGWHLDGRVSAVVGTVPRCTSGSTD